MRSLLKPLAALIVAYAVISRALKHVLGSPTTVGPATIGPLHDDTSIDQTGACRSVQSADVRMPTAALAAIWTPKHLERLARTYWRFLSRCTLGLVRVEYTEAERFVVFLRRPFVLLAFKAPEYEMDARRGIVRWGIERGVLVAPPGIGADGYLEIDMRRTPTDDPEWVDLHVEVEVANYYPRIASDVHALGLRGHAVAHPRARHVRVPAVARQARPRGVQDRPLRRHGRAAGSRGPRSQRALGRPGREPRPERDHALISRSARRSANAACRGCGSRARGAPCPSASA